MNASEAFMVKYEICIKYAILYYYYQCIRFAKNEKKCCLCLNPCNDKPSEPKNLETEKLVKYALYIVYRLIDA